MLSGVGKTLFVGGPAGPPNSLSIRNVVTGAPGSQAQVQINGAAPAQTLDLTIPQGPVGATGAVPWAPIQAWATGLLCVASAPATLVYVGGTAYVCAVSHIAGTFAADLAAGKWAQVAPGGLQPWKTPPVAWAASTAYTAAAPADCITYQGGCYVCSASHTSGGSFDASKWTQIAAPGSVNGALQAANNLSDVANAPAAVANLGVSNVPVRQTALSGPAASGAPSFVPATSPSLSVALQNVSASVPLIVTAAQGFAAGGQVDYTLAITSNYTWPGLTANAVNFCFINTRTGANFVSTLAPIYQFGGAISTANGQFTFDYLAMVGYLGNGSAAVPTPLVCLYEAATNGSGVTSTIAYAYRGFYQSPVFAVAAGSVVYAYASNLGVGPAAVEAMGFTGVGASGPWFTPALSFWSTPYTTPSVSVPDRNTLSFTSGRDGIWGNSGGAGTGYGFMRARRAF